MSRRCLEVRCRQLNVLQPMHLTDGVEVGLLPRTRSAGRRLQPPAPSADMLHRGRAGVVGAAHAPAHVREVLRRGRATGCPSTGGDLIRGVGALARAWPSSLAAGWHTKVQSRCCAPMRRRLLASMRRSGPLCASDGASSPGVQSACRSQRYRQCKSPWPTPSMLCGASLPVGGALMSEHSNRQCCHAPCSGTRRPVTSKAQLRSRN